MPTIKVNDKSAHVSESKRPRGYRVSFGAIGDNCNDNLVLLIAAVQNAGYTIIKAEIQTSTHGGLAVVFFK